MPNIKHIGFLGEDDKGPFEQFHIDAFDLATALATRKINIVYGGGVWSLPAVVAMSASGKGIKVISIALKDASPAEHTFCTHFKVPTAFDRVKRILLICDAFIALPGSLQTLEDTFCIIFWANKNFHKKPIGFLNLSGFYDGIISFFDKAVELGLMSQATRSLMVSASTAEELLNKLQPVPTKPTQGIKRNRDGSKKPDTTLCL